MATATDPADIALGLRYGLPVQQAAQRSQYLAAALQNLQAQSAAPKSYGETALRLLADGILQSKRTGTDQALISALQGQRQSMAADALSGLPDGSAPQSAPSAPPLASSVSAPPVDAPQVAPAPSAPAAALGAALSGTAPRGLRNNNPLNVTSLPKGQQWNGQTGSDGTYAQFATPQDGWNAADKNLANYGKLHGINTEAGVINRWAPGAQAAPYIQTVSGQTGIAPNAPIDLSSPQVRQTLLTGMAGVENGQPMQFGQAMQPGQPQPSPAAMMQPQPLPSGVAPPPLAPPPAAPPQQAAGGASAPVQFPHEAVTPEEVALARKWMANPQTYDQGLALAQKLQQRQAGTLSDPSKPYIGPDGQAHYAPGMSYQDVQGPANAFVQRGPDNKISVTANPSYGAIPEGTQLQGGGQVVPLQGAGQRPLTNPAERAALGIRPDDQNAYSIGPGGKVMKTADAPYGPTQIQGMRDNFWGSDETKKYGEALSALNGLNGIIGKMSNNGVMDTAAIDSYLRGINPGMGARNTTVTMFLSHLGLPTEIESHVNSLMGKGYLTPETLGQMQDVIKSYAQAHYDVANARAKADASFAAKHGFDASALGEELPTVPASVPIKSNAPAPAAPNGQPAFSDIAAEIARRRAAGTMK